LRSQSTRAPPEHLADELGGALEMRRDESRRRIPVARDDRLHQRAMFLLAILALDACLAADVPVALG